MRTALWRENIQQAFETLAANRLRAALTLLGILIGVAAVIAMVAIGRGVQNYINSQFAALGTNLIFVIPVGATEGPPGGAALQDISSLTMRDVRAIEQEVRGRVTAVVPVIQRFGPLESEGREAVTVILGTTPGYAPARNWPPRHGTFLEEGHLLNRSRVIVLGLTPARRLFPDVPNPVGRTVRINGVPFRVIGVMSDKGGSAFGDYNDLAFIPITVAQEMLYDARDPRTGELLVTGIMLQAARAEYTDEIVRRITTLLRERHRIRFQDEDDFAILTQFELISIFGQISSVLTVFLGALGAISLIVGGHRDHEHHAGLGDRADAGDRPAQGRGGPSARHPAPVPHRGHPDHHARRRPGGRGRDRPGLDDQRPERRGRAGGGGPRHGAPGRGGERRCWTFLRPLPGLARRPARPHCRPALRVTG